MNKNTFKTVPFGDLYAEPAKNGIMRPKRVRGSGYKMINMGELFSYDRIKNPEMELVPLNDDEIKKYAVKQGDLLFARQSLILEGAGKCSIVLDVPETTTFESHIIRVRLNTQKVSPQYYFYYFLSPQGKNNIKSIKMQVAAAGIRGSDLQNVLVPVPELTKQDKIAKILTMYDDLIENNTRRIKILEEMAQRIYREWFVHFRYPGHENQKLVESELGMIPEGWEVGNFTDIASVLSGGTPQTGNTKFWNGEIQFFTPRDAGDSYFVFGTEKTITELGLRNCNSQLYPEDTIFITARGTVGKVVIAGKEMAMNQSCYALKGINRNPNIYVFFVARNHSDHFRKNSGGATFSTIIVDTFRRTKVLLPASEVISLFCDSISPLLRSMKILIKKCRILSATRDLLLPKLISGELRIPDAERIAGRYL